MKKLIINTLGLLFIVILLGCSKSIAPSLSQSFAEDIKTDDAEYNYLFINAMKAKLFGEYGDAISLFQECTKLKPSSDASYFHMGEILTLGGNFKEGIACFKKAKQIDPTNKWYDYLLATSYYNESSYTKDKNSLDSAIYYYKLSMDYHPSLNQLIALGTLYSESEKYSNAVEVFENIDDKYGVNDQTTPLLIRNLISISQYDRALEKASLLTQMYPDSARYEFILADIYSRKGNTTEAQRIYLSFLDEDPTNPQVMILLCESLLEEGRYDETQSLLNTLIVNEKIQFQDIVSLFDKINSHDEFIKFMGDRMLVTYMILESAYKGNEIAPLFRIDYLYKQERYDEAIEILQKQLVEFPNNYLSWERLLICYYEKKDFINLEKSAEICSNRFNRSYLSKILYATAANENGNFDLAVRELDKAMILAGNDEDRVRQVFSMQADVYYSLKQYEKCFDIYDTLLYDDPNNVAVMNNYAYYLAEQDSQLDKALKMSKVIVKEEPLNPTYLDTYGWVLYKLGKFNKSNQVFKKIFSISKEPNAEYYEHYGFIMKSLNKNDEAINSWSEALRIDDTKKHLEEEINKCRN